MQTFYGLLAMMLVALLSLTVMRTTHSQDTRMYVNEVVTQASGVGIDVLEAVGRRAFDAKTDTTKVTTFPAVTNPNQLTPESNFGGCTKFSLCEDIDDFDNMVLNRTQDGFRFTVTITVRYVSPDNPGTYSAAQTYAKEVLVEVANPFIFLGSKSNPITVPFRRVFTYQKSTTLS